jgi:hypothetical protein
VIGGTYKTSVLYYTVMDLPALEELSGMDPASLQLAFKAALTLKRTIDTAKLKRQVKEIEDAVDLLGTRLDEALLIDLATAYDHLAASRRAANDDLRRAELNNARVSFNRLTRRPRTGPVAAGSEKLTHEQLVAIGHLGNFHYFLLSDDPRQALEQAYTCATMFPLLAIEMFPPEIFSRDYHAELRSITRRADERRAMVASIYGKWRGSCRWRAAPSWLGWSARRCPRRWQDAACSGPPASWPGRAARAWCRLGGRGW